MKKINLFISLTYVLSLLTFSSYSLATTPDGQTPNQENICNTLTGATSGLFGLCIAYCEAQDCDYDGVLSGQCKKPNHKILENYNRIKQVDDPEMPCIPEPEPDQSCPCFNANDLVMLNLDKCHDTDATTFRVTTLSESGSTCSTGNFAGDQTLLSSGEIDGEKFSTCRLLDFSSTCEINNFIQSQNLPDEETNACRQLMLDEAEARGLLCESLQ